MINRSILILILICLLVTPVQGSDDYAYSFELLLPKEMLDNEKPSGMRKSDISKNNPFKRKNKAIRNKRYYTNPVIDYDFPDPAIIRADDGYFYTFGTNTKRDGVDVNIQVARSGNLTEWEYIGDALPEKPSWANETQTFWAPHVIYDNKKRLYFMYYSAGINETNDKCLAVAVSKNPDGPYIDKGVPLLCGEGFVNIDPMAFDDPVSGKKLLYWGSGFKPIKVRELNDDRISFVDESEVIDLVFPGKDKDYNILIEGAWVIFHNDMYYMFYSGDNCCGERANYAVMVARSHHPTGPFERFGESNGTGSSVILHKNEKWNAPGHNSVLTDDAGCYWILYHAIDTENILVVRNPENSRRVMLLDRIDFFDDWPVIENNKPSVTSVPAPNIYPEKRSKK